jgi:hypothetical protein
MDKQLERKHRRKNKAGIQYNNRIKHKKVEKETQRFPKQMGKG